jgi:hypothetical protein
MNEKTKDELDGVLGQCRKTRILSETPRSDASPKFENNTIQQL